MLFVPPIPDGMGILDWHRHVELFDAAYRWGLKELARLKDEGNHLFAGAKATPTR